MASTVSNRYAADLDWNESAKQEALRKGMSEDLKRDIIHMPEDQPTRVQFVTAIQQLDNRRRAFQLEFRSSFKLSASHQNSSTTYQRATTPATTTEQNVPRGNTATGTQAGPMDLPSNRRRLTPEERQRRMVEGRYRYCGGLGYMAATCPVAPRPLRAA